MSAIRFTLAILGRELFTVELDPDVDRDEDGTDELGSTPMGFTPTPGDQRWERGTDTR